MLAAGELVAETAIQRHGKVEDQIKRLDLTLSKHVFDGSDPIRVLTSSPVREANILEMSDAQAYLALKHFLRGFA